MYTFCGKYNFNEDKLNKEANVWGTSYKEIVKCFDDFRVDGHFDRNTVYEALTDYVFDGRQFVAVKNGYDSERIYEKQNCIDNEMKRNTELSRWKKSNLCLNWLSNRDMENKHTEDGLITLFRAFLEIFTHPEEEEGFYLPPFIYVQKGGKILLYNKGDEQKVIFNLKGVLPSYYKQ